MRMKHRAFANRFRQAVAHAKAPTTQQELGKFLGVSGTMAWNYLNGEKLPGMSTATRMAERLGVNVNWLLTGQGEMLTSALGESNVEIGPDIRGAVPEISWVQAGAWCEVIDLFEPGDADHWWPCPVPHGPHTYVLRVRGNSMTAPHGISFPDGELIFVDPDVPPENGRFVIVKLEDTQEATFKKLVIEGKDMYLEALNPSWPDRIMKIGKDARFCGAVIFKGTPL